MGMKRCANVSEVEYVFVCGHFGLRQIIESKDFKQFQDSASHGGEDVPIYAVGPMAHLIHTTHDQTHIANVMAYSACVGAYKDLFEQRCRT